METKKRMEVNQNIENILNRLEAINEEEEELNELDPSIFNYYKGKDKEEPEGDEDIDEDKFISRKRNNPADYNPKIYEKPISKHTKLEILERSVPEEEEVIDLTKSFQ